MDLAKSFINFYIYSSLHIALCACALYAFNVFAFQFDIDTHYLLFVLSSTILTYGLHRIVGIKYSSKYNDLGRYAIVNKYKLHIYIYTILSGLYTAWAFMQFDISRQLLLIAPGLISILYTLPIFFKRRLRDISFIKIFLIAMVWSYVTEILPLYEKGLAIPTLILLFCERVFFFLGLTLPFDMRDSEIDKTNQVKTLASLLGNTMTIRVSLFLIIVATVIGFFNYFQFGPDIQRTIALTATYTVVIFTISKTTNHTSDYLYSGILDGMIALPLLIYIIIK